MPRSAGRPSGSTPGHSARRAARSFRTRHFWTLTCINWHTLEITFLEARASHTGYRTSSPVIARPMMRRWISEVPLEDSEVVGRAWSPAARMLTIFPPLTEQRRNRLADTCRMVLVTLNLASRSW
jgi:hypothetical protein